MRLKEIPTNNNLNMTDMSLFFENCLGEELPQKQLRKLSKIGKFYKILYDSKERIAGYVFQDNNQLLSVYGLDGTEWSFCKYMAVRNIDADYTALNMPSEVFAFKTPDDLYDIYYGMTLICKNVEDFDFIQDSADNKTGRFLRTQLKGLDYVYDLKSGRCIAKISCDYITDIHGTFGRIIYQKDDDQYNLISYVVNFYGDEIAHMEKFSLLFTNTERFYMAASEYDTAGIAYEAQGSDEIELVTCADYHYIYHLLSDKAVVLNDTTRKLEIISYKKKSNKWVYDTEFIDDYDELTDIQIFEDTDEAILCFRDSRKMLLSHYLQDIKNENFLCTDIFYEGNGVFKCFHNEHQLQTDITYICSEQAISYESQNDKHIHTLIDEANLNISFLLTNGTKVFSNSHVTLGKPNAWNKRTSFSFKHNYMTVEPEGLEDLVIVNSFSKSKINKNYLINGVTGDLHEFQQYPLMVWHNLYLVDKKLHLIENKHNYGKNAPENIIATFNDYIVIWYQGSIYVCDRNFDIQLEVKCDVNIDVMNRRVILIADKNTAYTVSNEGIEVFKFLKHIRKHPVFESTNHMSYIIDGKFVTQENLREDFDERLIDYAFKILI